MSCFADTEERALIPLSGARRPSGGLVTRWPLDRPTCVCQTIAHIGSSSQTEKKFQILPKGLIKLSILFSLIKMHEAPFVTQQYAAVWISAELWNTARATIASFL